MKKRYADDLDSWNKGTKGVCKPNSGSFKKGNIPNNKGKKQPEEQKQRQSVTMKQLYADGLLEPNSTSFKKGQKPWNAGKTGVYSEETIKKRSATFQKQNPGFKGHNFGKKLSAETRKKIREKRWEQAPIPQEGNKFELSVFNALREGGIEFEQHKKIIGIPDIFIKPNLCIFLDSDFHHANPSTYPDDFIIWPSTGMTAKSKRLYDKKIRDELRAKDYKLITGLWYSDWKKDKEKFFQKILKAIKEAKSVLE